MNTMKLVIIGYGAVGQTIVKHFADVKSKNQLLGVLVRPESAPRVREKLLEPIKILTSIEEVITAKPEIVVECAGQQAFRQYGLTLLHSGIDLMIIATGALADDKFRGALIEAGRKSGAKIHVPAGATAGLDGLGALKAGGLEKVTYISTTPCNAWKGTPAEFEFELANLNQLTQIFYGNAREAALKYPQNANLAATIALAGIGFDKTCVSLMADPNAKINTGEIKATGNFGQMKIEMRGQPLKDNPKTSAVTAFSLIHAINRQKNSIII